MTVWLGQGFKGTLIVAKGYGEVKMYDLRALVTMS